jgi:hypothetical protein
MQTNLTKLLSYLFDTKKRLKVNGGHHNNNTTGKHTPLHYGYVIE